MCQYHSKDSRRVCPYGHGNQNHERSHTIANYESEWWAFGSRYRPCSTSPRFSQQHPRGGSSSWNRDGQEFGQHLFAALTADPRTRFPNTTVIPPPHPDASLVGPGKSGHRHQWQRGWAVHFSIAKAGVSNMFFFSTKRIQKGYLGMIG